MSNRLVRIVAAAVVGAGVLVGVSATPASASCSKYAQHNMSGTTEFSLMTHSGVKMYVSSYGILPYQASVPSAAYISIGDSKLIMQSDGNLVLYNQCGTPRWASNTAHKPTSASVYSSMTIQHGVWELSGEFETVHKLHADDPSHGFYLAIQADGNLVLYKNVSTWPVVWASGTNQ